MSPTPISPNHMAALAIIECTIYIISLFDSTWFLTDATVFGSCNIGLFKSTCAALGAKKTYEEVIYPIAVPIFILIAISLPKVVGGYTRYAMVFEVIMSGAAGICSMALMIAVLVLDQGTDASHMVNHSNYGVIVYVIMIIGIINGALFITGLTEGLVSLYDRTSPKKEVPIDNDTISLVEQV